MLIVCSKFTVLKDDIDLHRDVESFIILNFVVLYSGVFKLYSMSLYHVFEYLVIHCLHLHHNTLNM
jgi:hypothetical protein